MVAGLEVGLLADERLGFDLGASQVRLDRIVLGVELMPVEAVSLFQPTGGAVNADTHRHDTVGLSGSPQRVPQGRPLLERSVEFPTQLPYVRDPEGPDRNRPDFDRLRS